MEPNRADPGGSVSNGLRQHLNASSTNSVTAGISGVDDGWQSVS